MGGLNYKYIHFVRFSQLHNWSVQYAVEHKMNFTHKYPMVRIGSFLSRNTDRTEVQDDVIYKRITVRTNNGGVCLRDEVKGSSIGTKKQTIVKAGQFIVSKIDARNGAFGIIPEELDGAIVTQDFPTFDVDNSKVLTQFLVLVSTTPTFIEFAKSCSNGTTNRKRIDVDEFLEQMIPLPTLQKQKKILDSYNENITIMYNLQEEVINLKSQLYKNVQVELGVNPNSQNTISGNFFKITHFKDVKEWGVDFILKKKGNVSKKYETKKIKDLCSVGSGGTPSRSNKSFYNGNIPWIKTGEILNNIITSTEESITMDAIEHSSAKVYPKGSLIMAMYGQGDTRGRTAKLGIDAATNQACAVMFNINDRIIMTDYLWLYLQVMYNDIRLLASGNNQPNLNAEKIKNYDVILPPFVIQQKLIELARKTYCEINGKTYNIKVLRKRNNKNFESLIFKDVK